MEYVCTAWITEGLKGGFGFEKYQGWGGEYCIERYGTANVGWMDGWLAWSVMAVSWSILLSWLMMQAYVLGPRSARADSLPSLFIFNSGDEPLLNGKGGGVRGTGKRLGTETDNNSIQLCGINHNKDEGEADPNV